MNVAQDSIEKLLWLQVIIIDEAQFFPDLYEFCCTAADEDAKTVIVAGLSGDFRRQKFGQVRRHLFCSQVFPLSTRDSCLLGSQIHAGQCIWQDLLWRTLHLITCK